VYIVAALVVIVYLVAALVVIVYLVAALVVSVRTITNMRNKSMDIRNSEHFCSS